MRRHCTGRDPNLVKGDGRTPCDCGLRFDDIDRSVVYPHQFVGGGALFEMALRPRGNDDGGPVLAVASG